MHAIVDKKPVAGSRILALGVVLAALVSVMLMSATPAHASTYTVTNTNDSGIGSLRRAIEYANRTVAADTIAFNVPGIGVATITPDSELPAITTPMTFDGYSQPGASENTLASGNNAVLRIELSGADAGTDHTSGLTLYAPSSTVKGLIINRWSGAGMSIATPGATGNRVVGNYIGTGATGTVDFGNAFGVHILEAFNNTVGGTTPAARNVISGNEVNGVFITGASCIDNEVKGNYIGTATNGTSLLGNSGAGVAMAYGHYNVVGGTEAGAGNRIFGNDRVPTHRGR
jgi:hypothetical protein